MYIRDTSNPGTIQGNIFRNANDYGLYLLKSKKWRGYTISNNCFENGAGQNVFSRDRNAHFSQNYYDDWDGVNAYEIPDIPKYDNNPLDKCHNTPSTITPYVDYHFDECFWNGTSGEVFDNSSNHFNATAINNATTDYDSILCKSGDFTNSNYVEPTNQIPLPSSFTITVWVKFPLSSSGHSNFFEFGRQYQYYNIADRPGTNDDFIYFKKSLFSGIWLWCVDGDFGNPTCKNFTMNLTGWHHLAFVSSGSTTKMFIDSVLKDTINKKPSGKLNLIGASDYKGDYNGQTIGALIDEFKIFNKGLTPNQIKNIYDNESTGKNWNGTERTCITCEPIADYHMDECGWNGTSNEVIDSTSHNYNGTGYGANTVKSSVIGGGICRVGYFDGSNDYIEIPQNASNILKGTASLSFWIKTTQSGNNIDWEAPGIIGIEESGGTNDIFWGWIDASGHIGISKGDNYNNSKSYTSINDNNWHHIVLTRNAYNGQIKIYIDGSLDRVGVTDTGIVGTSFSSIGRIENTDTSKTPKYFQGYLDEVKIFNYVLSNSEVADIYANESSGKNWWDGSERECNSCEVPVDHYEIDHDGIGLTCQPEQITIKACSDNNTPCSEYSLETSATLNYNTTSQNYTFTGSTAANVIHQTPGIVTLSLTNMNPVPANNYKCYNSTTGSNSCDITFYDSGFIFDIQNDYSCKPQTVTIKAVRKDDTTQKCVPAFQNKTLPVDFSYTYLNPATGSIAPQINGNNLNTTINLTFDNNGETTFNFKYSDAGIIGINASFTTTTVKAAGSDNATFKPVGFYVYTTTSNWEADNGSNSTVFKKAGTNFNLTAKAVCWESDTDVSLYNNTKTSNYNKNNILITSSLIAPASGTNGELSEKYLNFNNGIASIDNQTYSEVGIIKITVKDSDYLGTGSIIGTSENIGRFIPDHFIFTKINDGILQEKCSTFNYIGDTTTYSTPPSFKIIAKNKDNQTTKNYKDSFSSLTTGSITINYPTEDDNQVGNSKKIELTITKDTPILSDNNGTFTYTFGNDNITYLKNDNSKISPFTPQFSIDIAEIKDNDNVECNNLPVSLIVTGQRMKYGKLKIYNNYGPETKNLKLILRTLYWDNGEWQTNSEDSCIVFDYSDFNLSNFTDKLTSDDTNIIDINQISNGIGSITLKAPGENKYGSVDVDFSKYSFLHNNDSIGKATFGIYRGRDRIIMWEEVPAR